MRCLSFDNSDQVYQVIKHVDIVGWVYNPTTIDNVSTPSPDLGERICVRNKITDSEQMKPACTNVQQAKFCELRANSRQDVRSD